VIANAIEHSCDLDRAKAEANDLYVQMLTKHLDKTFVTDIYHVCLLG
jgi:hypothetical protein